MTSLTRRRNRSWYFNNGSCELSWNNKVSNRHCIAYRSAVVAAIVCCVVSVALRTVFCIDDVAVTDNTESPYNVVMNVMLKLLDVLRESLDIVPKR